MSRWQLTIYLRDLDANNIQREYSKLLVMTKKSS